MGCCCSLFGWGGKDKDSEESKSFLMKEKGSGTSGTLGGGGGTNSSTSSQNDGDASLLKGPKYYQAIIDDANNKFLNAPSQVRKKALKDTDAIRSKLMSVDSSIATSPPPSSIISRNCNPDIANHNRSVVNVLSEYVVSSDRFDAAVVEIAQVIGEQTKNMRLQDPEKGPVLMQLQTVRSHR